MVITIILKIDLGAILVQGSGHKWDWLLIQVDIRIKTVIIIILKLDSRIDIGRDPGHEDDQHKIKMVIIIILKLDSSVNPGWSEST